MKKIWIGAIAIILIVVVVAIGFSMTGFVTDASPSDGGDSEQTSLAECLTENGAILYGTEWCGYCQRQKESFGDSFSDVTFIDCDYNRDACVEAGISGYPTWRINGQNYPGLQSLEKLSSLTGCEL